MLSAEKKKRNLAIFLGLLAFVAVLFAVTIVKIKLAIQTAHAPQIEQQVSPARDAE